MKILRISQFYYIRNRFKFIWFRDIAKYAIFEGSKLDEAISDIVRKFNCPNSAGIIGFNTKQDTQSAIDWIESFLVMDKLTE